jgi:peptidoglycan/LPS O-acetylase OafA/YrhL
MVWGMRRIRPAGVLAVTSAVVIASCCVVPALGLGYAEKALIVTRALEVLGGAFLAFELWPEVRERAGVSRRETALLVAATFAVLVGMLAFGLGGRWLYRAAGLALTAAVVYGRAIQRAALPWLTAAAVTAGGLSFAVYLLHEPVLIAIRLHTGGPGRISLPVLAAVALVAVVALAVLFTGGLAWLGRVRSRPAVGG